MRALQISGLAGCYMLIATSRHSRPKVHDLYRRLGFEDHGIEFRMDLATFRRKNDEAFSGDLCTRGRRFLHERI
jgi:hypothetical protein